MKHSTEERLLAVQKCLKGYAPKAVGRGFDGGLNPPERKKEPCGAALIIA